MIEWPEADGEPTKYFLSTAPAEATLEQLVFVTKLRRRIERDYQELKQGFGLSHYEGRGWRGIHHHATLCIAAYGFLVAQRLSQGDSKKTALDHKRLPHPQITCLAAAGRAQRHVPDSIPTLRFLIAVLAAVWSNAGSDTVKLGMQVLLEERQQRLLAAVEIAEDSI